MVKQWVYFSSSMVGHSTWLCLIVTRIWSIALLESVHAPFFVTFMVRLSWIFQLKTTIKELTQA